MLPREESLGRKMDQDTKNVEIPAKIVSPPNLVPTNLKMVPPANLVVAIVMMLIPPTVTVRQVDPRNCAVVIEEGPPDVLVDTVKVHRILQPRGLGQDSARSSGTDSSTGNPERGRIWKGGFSF